MTDFVKLNGTDNVVTVTRSIELGTEISGITSNQNIPRGHKFAIQDIAIGDPILKYAQKIGYASLQIHAGDHVHTHNVEFRNVDADYEYSTNICEAKIANNNQLDTFMGYRRENGKVGTRNYIAIVTSVNCSATAARKIADAFGPEELKDYPNIDGVVAFVHGTGCGMADSGDGMDALQRVMWGYAKHPNHAGVLMLGLGCEINQIDWLLEVNDLKQGPLFHTMNIQDVAGLRITVEKGIERIRTMLPEANKSTRERCPVSELKVGLQCGGSDAWSGITANPALGYASDLIAAQKGTALLAETPEIYGAEHLLLQRVRNKKTGDKLLGLIRWWEDYTERNKGSMDNNPSPGNKKGGLTTILEKSLGASAKGGTSPLNAVYKYGEEIRSEGFAFMDSPGYDPASVTGQIASGCNIIVFTTGRGSAFGSKPAPTIKVASNSIMYNRMNEDMDVNAGDMLEGVSLEEKGREMYDLILRVASGEKSKSEAQGLGDHEFVPWQIGAVM